MAQRKAKNVERNLRKLCLLHKPLFKKTFCFKTGFSVAAACCILKLWTLKDTELCPYCLSCLRNIYVQKSLIYCVNFCSLHQELFQRMLQILCMFFTCGRFYTKVKLTLNFTSHLFDFSSLSAFLQQETFTLQTFCNLKPTFSSLEARLVHSQKYLCYYLFHHTLSSS